MFAFNAVGVGVLDMLAEGPRVTPATPSGATPAARLTAVCGKLRKDEGIEVVTEDEDEERYNTLRKVWNAGIDRHVRT